MKIEFNNEEISTMLGLIDLAIKAGGLNVADAGLMIARKIKFAQQQEQDHAQDEPSNE